MRALPMAIADTRPDCETVAIAVLSELHEIARPVKTLLLAPNVVAVAWVVSPGLRELLASDTLTDATGSGASAVTVSKLFPVWLSHDAIICAVPTAIAVTSPVDDTVATPLLLDVHVITRPVSTLLFASRVVAVA